MRILFVYPDLARTTQGTFAPGVACLSAVARAKGHETALLRPTSPPTREGVVRRVDAWRPDLIALSFPTLAVSHVRRWVSWTREATDAPILCGGIHTTIRPREVLSWSAVDAVCVGEGDRPFGTIADRLGRGEPLFDQIPGVWTRNGTGPVRESGTAIPVLDLDELPFADRDLFPPFIDLHGEGNRTCALMVSRGCPFQCSYCANPHLTSLRPRGHRRVRFRSPGSVVEEIRSIVRRFPAVERLIFFDDILTLRPDWLFELLGPYRSEFRIPFTCNSHVSVLTEPVVRALAEAGCAEIAMGLESGNPDVRRHALGRAPDDATIVAAFRLCHRYGLRTIAYNMLGIPGETFGRFLDTIHLNARARPDRVFLATFYPFPGTRLEEACRERGIPIPAPSLDLVDEAQPLALSGFPEREIRFARRHFLPLVRTFSAVERLPRPLSIPIARLLDTLVLARFPLLPLALDLPRWRSAAKGFARALHLRPHEGKP